MRYWLAAACSFTRWRQKKSCFSWIHIIPSLVSSFPEFHIRHCALASLWSSSSERCWAYNLKSAYCEISQEGWSSASTFFRTATTCSSSLTAFFTYPSTWYAIGGACCNVSREGWSSVLLFVSPASLYIMARLCMELMVSGCSLPSTLFPVSITCTCNSPASFQRHCYRYVEVKLAMLLIKCRLYIAAHQFQSKNYQLSISRLPKGHRWRSNNK